MKKKLFSGNCYLNNLKWFWNIWPWWPLTPKSIGFLYYPDRMYGPRIRKVDEGILELLVGNGFGTFDNSDLDLWPSDPKSIGFICIPGKMYWPSLKKVGLGVLQLLIGNRFSTFDPGDLDLWPNDPKISRVPLMPMTDVWTKFEVQAFSSYWSKTKTL